MRLQRMSSLAGRSAAFSAMGEGPQRAGHVSYIAVRPRLCKARLLRIAAISPQPCTRPLQQPRRDLVV